MKYLVSIVLDANSQILLHNRIRPIHTGKEYYHHLTLAYNPPQDYMDKLRASGIVGKVANVIVGGVAKNDRVQAALVLRYHFSHYGTNKVPHITLSTAPGASPVESNQLDWSTTTNMHELFLQGVVTVQELG